MNIEHKQVAAEEQLSQMLSEAGHKDELKLVAAKSN